MAGHFQICCLILGVDIVGVIVLPYLVGEVGSHGGLISICVAGHLCGYQLGLTDLGIHAKMT